MTSDFSNATPFGSSSSAPRSLKSQRSCLMDMACRRSSTASACADPRQHIIAAMTVRRRSIMAVCVAPRHLCGTCAISGDMLSGVFSEKWMSSGDQRSRTAKYNAKMYSCGQPRIHRLSCACKCLLATLLCLLVCYCAASPSPIDRCRLGHRKFAIGIKVCRLRCSVC